MSAALLSRRGRATIGLPSRAALDAEIDGLHFESRSCIAPGRFESDL